MRASLLSHTPNGIAMSTEVRGHQSSLQSITDRLVESYSDCGQTHHLGHEPLPSQTAVNEILTDLFEVLYPGYGQRQNLHQGNIAYHVGGIIDGLYDKLLVQICRALKHERCRGESDDVCEEEAERRTTEMLQALPELRHLLELDVAAAFRGDPAARSHHEIIFCYPGLEAVTIYRLANILYRLNVPFIPRMMTELAHVRTGIDIHPGATIGPGFFIDHGTGVVIGETTLIGENVKVYQGVTLGALSFDRDDSGQLVHGAYKRHPTLADNVVVYANATILGGNTVIGEGAVIGSNVWLTRSVEPYSVVVLESPRHRVKGGRDPKATEDILMYHI